MKVFISGPMTGIEDYNFPAFNEAERYLSSKAYNVVNPVKICKKYKKELVLSDKSVFDKMVNEELAELSFCDAIYMLKGWELSDGSRKELKFAIDHNMSIMLEKETVNSISDLEYESLRDEAMSMARTLQKIEQEVHECAMCGGREDCGYSAERLMKEICYLLYQSEGYHHSDKYELTKVQK